MPLRKSADWMGITDDRILEILDMLNEGATVEEIQDELADRGSDLNHRHMFISIRCDFLTDAGLLSFDFDAETYEITQMGRDYLTGECDVGNVGTERPYQDTRNIDFVP